jgi:hypothetical protein
MFLVLPENLPEVMRAGRLAAIPPDELHGFAKMRADYKQAGLRKHWAK